MAITPANETDNLDAFGEEGTKNWYTPLSKLVLFVDLIYYQNNKPYPLLLHLQWGFLLDWI